MKTNRNMSALLQRAGLQWPLTTGATATRPLSLELVSDCVLLKSESERNKHLKVSDFPDRTGFECFVNHVHLPFTGSNESLTSCLRYAATVQEALIPFTRDRHFRVIVTLPDDDDCTVRFHQIRPGENWITEELEGYKSEAILVFDVPESQPVSAR
jgi:hypothetical protein